MIDAFRNLPLPIGGNLGLSAFFLVHVDLAAFGYRESAESWKAVLRDLKRRGKPASVVTIGDGARVLGRRARRVAEDSRTARWVTSSANIHDKLPRRLQPLVKATLHEVTGQWQRTGNYVAQLVLFPEG